MLGSRGSESLRADIERDGVGLSQGRPLFLGCHPCISAGLAVTLALHRLPGAEGQR